MKTALCYQDNEMFEFQNVISPKKEMLAFEAIWAKEGMTEKKFTALFKHNNKLPSEILNQQLDFLSEDLTNVENYLDNIKTKFSVCLVQDFQFPEKLKDAEYPLELFYYRGDINLINENCISVVGSRKCSEEGLRRTRKLVKGLVEQNLTIVSGLASGVDTAALETAIAEKGKVVGVIGTPINQVYPRENAQLQEEIAKDHLLISQVPFYRYDHEPFEARKHYFPRRNATMAAISNATIIVEASDTSGTLTQARAALKQDRKLFILDSCFENSNITWPAKYESMGAIRVRKIEDILENL